MGAWFTVGWRACGCPFMRLPRLPAIDVRILEELSALEPGFLRLVRHRLRVRYPDGTVSEPFSYDTVARDAVDAVVIAAYYQTADGPWVYLRSSVRPPILLCSGHALGKRRDACLWELPAGMVEPEEGTNEEGVARCAQRELAEELGFEVPLTGLHALGNSTFPAPSVMGERHFYFEVEVDPTRRGQPGLDGSPLERHGVVAALPLHAALAMCRSGQIEDEKTELALRRLAERLG